MIDKNKLEKIMYALTLFDRPNKREQWLKKGFSIINKKPKALLNYWYNRLQKQNPSDLSLYYIVERRYTNTHVINDIAPPSPRELINLSIEAATKWSKAGLPNAPKHIVKTRNKICNECEFWDSKAMMKTGQCKICGCSTWAKIRMSTEKCPIGKWNSL